MDTFDQWFNRPFASFRHASSSTTGTYHYLYHYLILHKSTPSHADLNTTSHTDLNTPSFSTSPESGGGSDDASSLSQEEKLLIVNRLHEVIRPFMLRYTTITTNNTTISCFILISLWLIHTQLYIIMLYFTNITVLYI